MSLIAKEDELHQLMRQWRRDLHAYPETAYEEHRTSAKVAELLKSFGLEVVTGLGKTGVVGTLQGKQEGSCSIAVRADMDALNLQELNTFAHCSKHEGKMHACGHDGHTTMLLGAAKYLSEHRAFSGKAIFIFQPAEEGDAGAKAMCDDGLFEQFDVEAVYGMHNWPGLEEGHFAVHPGPVMASTASFDITITGKGCHAGMPYMGVDSIVVAGQLITAMQSIISRSLDPMVSGVVSITKVHGGEAYNVVPDSVILSGTCRAFSEEVQQLIETRMRQQVQATAEAFGAKAELDYRKGYPATINSSEHADICSTVASQLVGENNVKLKLAPSMGAEDFSFMLQKKPGAYIWLGNGAGEESKGLHNPYYDFNDNILPIGANFWIQLIRSQLPTNQ